MSGVRESGDGPPYQPPPATSRPSADEQIRFIANIERWSEFIAGHDEDLRQVGNEAGL